jgi:PBP superfamily domain
MRTSIVGAAFLLVGAGAATVAAVDTTGNNLALNGSDTLFDVTTDVIAACKVQFADFAGNKITYKGGGSGVGAAQMQGTGNVNASPPTNLPQAQKVAPMSRALKNTEYCPPSGNSSAPLASPSLTTDLLVGIDGVAIVANTVNSCSDSVSNGFGLLSTFNVTADGTVGGTAAGSYTFANSFDALKVLYFGLTNDGAYNCASPVRKTLVKQWKNLFSGDCPAGNGTCSGGLTHAWRRSDLSGTTDAFVSILNPAGRGIGTLPNLNGSAQKVNPFCNSVDATTGVASFGGSGDFSDKDPIRTVCGANDGVCGPAGKKVTDGTGPGNFQGDLGVVLPILIPDGAVTLAADYYIANAGPSLPPPACTNACVLVGPIKGNQLPGSLKCIDGTTPVGGACYMPAVNGDPRCVSGTHNQCAGAAGKPDGRRYNLVTVVPRTQVPPAGQASTTYQFAYDVNSVPVATGANPIANPRFMMGSYYRIHANTAGDHNVPVTGTTGKCQENDDTSQIGCLVDSDPCSVGYAGREASKLFPGTGSPPTPVVTTTKALAVNGVTPYTPASINSEPNEALLNLLTTASGATEPFYPLARRLYFATMFGFGNLQTGEKELTQCFSTSSLVEPLITSHGFVAIPGGVQCLDYPEELSTTASPAANTRGAGAGPILGGCGPCSGYTTAFACGAQAGCTWDGAACSGAPTGHNTCTDPATAPPICGDGIVATSFGECEPPGTATCDANCKPIAP